MTPKTIEQASPDVREVLELAFFDIYGREPDKAHIPEWNQWRDREIRFTRFLDAEAYTDAALMLVPEGWGFTVADYWCDGDECGLPYYADCIDITRVKAGDYDAPVFEARSNHPALALASAALKAKGSGQ